MSDFVSDTKPTEEVKPTEEEVKPTEEVKPAEEKTVTEQATEAATSAATAVKDNVFSMFGGGPKKEKKEETDEGANEPSGSSKAVKAEVMKPKHVQDATDRG